MSGRARPALSLAVSALLAGSAVSGLPSRAADAELPPASEDYVLHCSACHGQDGRGTPGVTPSLHDTGGLLDSAEGRRYLARVPGVAQAPLPDARLARLLNWVLRSFGGAEASPPYSAREVGSLRQKPLRDPVAARNALATARH